MDGRPLPLEYSTAAEVVALLGLQPLDQEGGYFRRTAVSTRILPGSIRRAYSVIYALFTPEGFSALHRIAHDEIWCWHAGDALEMLQLSPTRPAGWSRIGCNLAAGESPQLVVPARTWQGARLVAGGRWALLSCIVAPEFDWKDFELGSRETLATEYPDFAEAIRGLSRKQPIHGEK